MKKPKPDVFARILQAMMRESSDVGVSGKVLIISRDVWLEIKANWEEDPWKKRFAPARPETNEIFGMPFYVVRDTDIIMIAHHPKDL